MLILLEKALLLACGTAVAAISGFDVLSLVGLLTTISMSCLDEWLMARRTSRAVTALPAGVCIAAALFMPRWCAFLPVVAYDMARSPALLRDDRADLLARCLPSLVPVAVAMPHMAAADRPSLMVAGLVCVAGMMMGRSRADVMRMRRSLRRTQDLARDGNRANRRRMADIAEERSQSVRVATLNERTRIAREIHDNVGHLLTRAIMQAQAGKAVADATGDTVAAQGFDALGGTLNEAMTMVRRSVHDLEDDGTDFAAQIEDAAHTFGETSAGFAVTLSNEITDAPAPVARCFAAVIRESLSNVARHSDARSASVTLRDFPAIWQLVVQDPGPAKPESAHHGTDDAESMRGMGLADIDSRVRALDGTSSSGPYGDGWRVFVTVPKRRWTYHDADGKHGAPAERNTSRS
ncbi:sensor histidine kinase [Bifidobacterium aerophilum]|uniref:Two-component sensor histidine kinase n=1 Tax=Bifidobacterium aerophilum TaxID=1798155 RepID=A0A6N9Z3W2_9BIFI|nr:histidine kinase [Bifidobacterium aerophilum]NEG89337.1 two-component sensor histidine kinase [Bifidobacterium aerophilum]